MKHEHVAFGAVICVALVASMIALAPDKPLGDVLQEVEMQRCTDTDGGENVFYRGHMEGEFSGTDYCTLGGQPVQTCRGRECKLIEFYCKKPLTRIHEEGASKAIICPPTAPVCDLGRCVDPSRATSPYKPMHAVGP